MKALTLTQPWAQLVADGRKRWETRGWRTTYRGPLAIHAAKGWTPDDRLFAADCGYEPGDLPRGVIVAVASIGRVVRSEIAIDYLPYDELEFGDYSPGRFAWRLDRVRRLAVPVPARGALGLWTVPDDALAAVMEQIR